MLSHHACHSCRPVPSCTSRRQPRFPSSLAQPCDSTVEIIFLCKVAFESNIVAHIVFERKPTLCTETDPVRPGVREYFYSPWTREKVFCICSPETQKVLITCSNTLHREFTRMGTKFLVNSKVGFRKSVSPTTLYRNKIS